MSRYLFDTNVWIRMLKGHANHQGLIDRWKSTPPSDLATCSIVRAELLHGARRYGQADRRTKLIEETLAPYPSLPFDDHCANSYAQIRYVLEADGYPIGPHDLLIAAICVTHGITLITSNTAEFKRVGNLMIEDW